jgi:alkylation response protein AidB-like acyl-CoA dehydrogenase
MAQDATGFALNVLNRFAGSDLADKLGLRKPVEKSAYTLTRTGFRLIATAARQFKGQKMDKPARLNTPGHVSELFDLNITEEQQMIRESVQAFAKDVLQPQAHDANESLDMSDELFAQANELGLTLFAVPESLGGAAAERSPVTSALVAEDLSCGDMSLALGILCPISTANALTSWGTGSQQATYLPSFCGDRPPLATIAVNEPAPLFNPHKLSTTATRRGNDWILNGAKAIVPLANRSEILLVAAQTSEGPAVFIVEGGAKGMSFTDGRGMGLRATGLCDIQFQDVVLPDTARLGDNDFNYRSFIDHGHLGWCALSVGTAQAALDYLITYANERIAFGEPISHRQAVAFLIANIGIELEGMRLLTWRAAARAEQGADFHRDAALARTLCAERGMEIGTNAVQLLGGHGFTKEHPVERWYRDLRAVGIQYNGMHL